MARIEGNPARAQAIFLAHSWLSEDGCPHPIPEEVFKPFEVRGTLDMGGGKAVGKNVLGEAIPAAKHRLLESVKEGEGTQQVNFFEGQN
ncbi:MAG: hypothetical protein ACD_30C00037G0005 [uncultured bacterium]|uniref:Uncharacterized protein n=3 Tax=Candidatus Daviesiibacteriota TaxID=1752718 RepID=A0A0G0EQB7_9BACT|nr:MAG: hypothetical protein ACD_30C00037G0005 [uncultured bacterium]KKQ09098.1 MAG: hypothetical protein US19_C0017G0043 [Candidatus Daviesbacteria bacterium GW2011_GWB1_36_5]KKQ16132.1 MAG: hypothetical protein US28_C0005G0047 [Candidatus Daviesbacteria bacterium GW2011_GWA1_36_8]OGE31405.1 MAG: hypothetical protein A3C99_02550 [Candidatus Daviesbacteria bacterium RIFCSPHIGHO2_02_FULL_37_9]OGE36421.1 MAG: hypothetical protein A3E66_04505 [Candidatus Daviesbacteria bacterium RIFCSPHIGHO2_12_FU